jgi:hypothetical protein
MMWELIDGFVATETDPKALASLAIFLFRAAGAEPEKIIGLVQSLLARTDLPNGDERDIFRERIGSLVFRLWLHHNRVEAKQIVHKWLEDRPKFKTELRSGIFSIRDVLVLGYGTTDPLHQAKRVRAQSLAFDVINRAAAGLESYMTLPGAEKNDARDMEASDDAELLDTMSDQFFYAIGPSDIRNGEPPRALGDPKHRKQFLKDNLKTFQCIGDIGPPAPVHNMMQLLEFLLPGDPATVFDLTCHALTNAGKTHGYQYESLGADQFVKMIGYFLADHRDLFDDQNRRTALVQVLEAFVEAGWPSARRLLHRLPDALR